MGKHKKDKHKKDKKKKSRKYSSESEDATVKNESAYAPPMSDKDGKFVWDKKQKVEGTDKLSKEEQDMLAMMKEKEKKIELWKVQRRREERELERAARAEELDRVRLEKEDEMFKEWQEQEGKFHLTQAQLRSEIRIKENRANPIDLLAFYINHSNDMETDIVGEPLTVVQNISIKDLEDLQADIKVYKDLDKAKRDLEYWNDLEVLVDAQLKKLNAELTVDRSRKAINAAVSGDISKVLKNKTSAQLIQMHAGIKKKIASGGPIDVSYWDKVCEQAYVQISRTRLQEKHADIMKKREFSSKSKSAMSGNNISQLFPISKPQNSNHEESKSKGKERKASDLMKIRKIDDADSKCAEEYSDLCYTPIRLDSIDMDAIVYTDMKLEREINEARCKVLSGVVSSKESKPADVGDLEEQAEALMGAPTEDEEMFNVDITLSDTKYTWSDKYKPRKPRFYNRVHTGYEWNKYNQTHYDQDNPPPKIVQGYKFNIFYQDLIDKTSTPQYTITVCKDDKEFSILRITAGPPYEDIAFKILNKEWEYSNRYSFKSQFSQGIFQLWFQFKKYRYRR